MVSFEYSVEEFIALFKRYLDAGMMPLPALNQAIYSLAQDYLLKVERITVAGFPLGSLTASGRFRDKVFVTRRGQETHVRRYVIPRDPKTAKQLAQRARVRVAVASWQNLTPAEKLQWGSAANQEGKCSGYHYYLEKYFRP